MSHEPALSVVIPTRNRADRLGVCLGALAGQTLAMDRFEVLVVLDGADEESRDVCRVRGGPRVEVIQAERRGIAHAKNVALERARGGLVVFLNDDVVPEAGFLEAHQRAHAELPADRPAMIVGHSPFAALPADEESLFDRMVRETSMVFFYDRMLDRAGRPRASRDHDWGFRHAWNLNLSVPLRAVSACGGFVPALANCCYEDVELAWRLSRRFGLAVVFRAEARAEHHHRFTPDSYLEREFRLGYSSLGLARWNPECAQAVFGVDPTDPREREAARAAVEAGSAGEAERLAWFRSLAWARSADPGGGGECRVQEAYERHLPLKRQWFRRGVLSGWAGERFPGLFHESDGLSGQPPLSAAADGLGIGTG